MTVNRMFVCICFYPPHSSVKTDSAALPTIKSNVVFIFQSLKQLPSIMGVFPVFEDFLQSHSVKKHCVMQIGRVGANLKYSKKNKMIVSVIILVYIPTYLLYYTFSHLFLSYYGWLPLFQMSGCS